jgi:TRIAD3 protein (E3 ubiquitin-protein ligase RNF216)
MDMSGCKHVFSDTELARVLTPKLLTLYHRMRQVKEVEAAGLSGLESCPFCEYKVVIENPDEKLFRCENEECGVASCRQCKKLVCILKDSREGDI